MNILFTLCGRAGSKGFKNKNLKDFLDIPLVYYSLATILEYKKIDSDNDIDLVINTDSKELMDIVAHQQTIACEFIERAKELGGDSVPKVAVIRDCLVQMEERHGKRYDMVVDLDITSPLRTVEDVKNAIDKKLQRNDTDVVFSVVEARRNPYFNMVKKEEKYFSKAIPSEYTGRQQAPDFYDMNASIYAYSVEALKYKEEKTFFNDKCDVIMMKDTGILDIDSEEDFELMQVIAKYLFKKEKNFTKIKEAAERL